MNTYNVALIQPHGYPHALATREVALLVHYSLQSLGLNSKATVNIFDPDSVNIVIGYQALFDPSLLANRTYIIYQLEQLSDREGWFEPRLLQLLQGAQAIWDYSQENLEFLRARGLTQLRHLPLGFHPQLQTIAKTAQDIDILFYGSVNDRRESILAALRSRCSVTELFEVYGQERDAQIARAKIVLNIHYFQAQIMEQVRLSYLLNNGVCVVSENSPSNPFDGMIATAPYDQLVETCLKYVRDDGLRSRTAQRGLELFRQQPMTELLRSVLNSPAK
ncbi:MAG: hypothetical protein ABSF29_14840 [Tepidisphaeraceae bacterium]|jgi:hypothetical protein